MKQAVCSKCGEQLRGFVPDEAKQIICFKCNEAENRREPDLCIVMLDPRYTLDALGFLQDFISVNDPRPAKEQFDEGYAFAGGWRPMPGFKMHPGGRLLYPGDPPMLPFAMTKIRDEVIMFYPHAFVCILQKDGTFEVARMD